MKLLTAVVLPHEVDAVRHAFERYAVLGMTLTEIRRASGGPDAPRELHRGTSVVVTLVPALRIESVVADELVERLLAELGARLGRSSDARITVRAVEHVVRVRTGERGDDAV